MPRVIIAVLSIVLVAPSSLSLAHAEGGEWSRFRGPNGSGVSSETGLPVSFGPDENVIWTTEVPFGRSSPAFTPDHIFLTAVEDSRLVTLALDRASGELLWKRSIDPAHPADLHHATDSSSASPVTDGKNVYSFFHEAGVVSYDSEGNERWRHEMGPFRNFYGIAASPVVHDGTLFLVADQVQGSVALALDCSSGEVLWSKPRLARLESYATPVFYPDASAPQELLVLGSSWIDAYDLESGEISWSMTGVGVSPVASPALSGDLLVVSAPDHAPEPMPPFSAVLEERDANGDGSLTPDEVTDFWMSAHFGFVDVDGNGSISTSDYSHLQTEMASDTWGLFGIRLKGDQGEPEILWNVRQSVPYIPSPLIYGNVVYVVKDSIFTSLDPATGEILKRGRLDKGKAGVNSSPVGSDGMVYVAMTSGKVAVLTADAEWEPLALNDMGEPIHATPVIADGGIYLRTDSRIYRLGAEMAGSPE